MSKTPKGLRLAAALRNARESRGLTLRELGNLTGRNSGVLSRYESAERTPKPEDVAQLLTAMEVRGDEYDETLSLAYDTDAHAWMAWSLPDQRQHLAAMVEMEQSARRIDHVSHSLFPGMLQSEEYMTAIMIGAGIPGEEIFHRVSIRKSRHKALRKDEPVEFISYVGESALHWLVGGREVMVGQFRHVLALADAPNVHLRIVPFSSGALPGMDCTFMVLDRSIVHADTGKSGVFLHRSDDVQSYIDSVERVHQVSCGRTESKAIVAKRLRELERTAQR